MQIKPIHTFRRKNSYDAVCFILDTESIQQTGNKHVINTQSNSSSQKFIDSEIKQKKNPPLAKGNNYSPTASVRHTT